ncbi:MAG: NYN domain-containing protein [Alicyclobacillaceae bacterium]|nr:NYN domain-containing protein [Alicyclobacillaceae bacterium]
MKEYVIVDAYNVIGASRELTRLKEVSLEEARHQLVEWLADYQAYTGKRVIVVFDGRFARDVPGCDVLRGVEICFTHANETADEWIERVVRERVRDQEARVYVATSDELEQRIVFGWGGLRLPAREFLHELAQVRHQVSRRLREQEKGRTPVGERLSVHIAEILEKWRRG